MVLRYLYAMNPDDDKAEVIIESDTIEPIVSCVEHFWDNLGVTISYYIFIDYEEKGIIIDFGHHYRFYQVIGFDGNIHDFAAAWRKSRKLK